MLTGLHMGTIEQNALYHILDTGQHPSTSTSRVLCCSRPPKCDLLLSLSQDKSSLSRKDPEKLPICLAGFDWSNGRTCRCALGVVVVSSIVELLRTYQNRLASDTSGLP